MATAAQHNQIIKVKFEGNTHLKHVLSQPEIKKMCDIEGRYPLTKLPVCGHCEKLALWSKDDITGKAIGICKACGTITKNPVTYSSYLASRQDVDSTGETFRRMARLDRNRDFVNRIIYLPDLNIGGVQSEFNNNRSHIANNKNIKKWAKKKEQEHDKLSKNEKDNRRPCRRSTSV